MDKKTIVLINPYRGIGDLIFHLPLIRGIYKKYKTKITLITNSANKAKFLLKNENSIKQINYISFDRHNLIKNFFLLLKKINDFNSDLTISTSPSKRLIIPLVISNSKKKIFFKKNNINDLSEYIFDQTKICFKNIKFQKNYNLIFKKKITKNKTIFISIDSHHDHNNWKEIYFIKLINNLINFKRTNKIYINFSPNKIYKFKKILKTFKKNNLILFTYKKKFSEIINIINNCSYIIGNESGPICLGASLNKKVFSLYDPIHTPNLSSKTINKSIIYYNFKKISANRIIKDLTNKIL